jgi:hypothetical protein
MTANRIGEHPGPVGWAVRPGAAAREAGPWPATVRRKFWFRSAVPIRTLESAEQTSVPSIPISTKSSYSWFTIRYGAQVGVTRRTIASAEPSGFSVSVVDRLAAGGPSRLLGVSLHAVLLILMPVTVAACSAGSTRASPSETTPSSKHASVSDVSSSRTPSVPTSTAASSRPSGAADPKSVMVAQFDAGSRAYQHCMVTPSQCDSRVLAATYDGAALANVRTFVSRLRTQHLRVRYPSASSYYGVVSTATVNGDARTGEITLCGVDGGVLYDQRDPASHNDDVVVNDELISSRDVWSMRLLDGRWKRTAVRNLVTWTGVNRCPARPAH